MKSTPTSFRQLYADMNMLSGARFVYDAVYTFSRGVDHLPPSEKYGRSVRSLWYNSMHERLPNQRSYGVYPLTRATGTRPATWLSAWKMEGEQSIPTRRRRA